MTKECKHVKESIDVNKLKNEVPNMKLLADIKCVTCFKDGTEDNLDKGPNTSLERTIWLCLACCQPHCSRKWHGILHYEENKSHTISLSLDTLVVWCYECDNEVDSVLNKYQVVLDQAKAVIRKHFQGFITPGLKNLGNTCFLNSLMQVIVGTFILHDAFTPSDPYYNPPHIDVTKCIAATSDEVGPLIDAFKEFLREMWQERDSTITLKNLHNQIVKKFPQFRGWRLKEIQEFMCMLFDEIKSEELEFIKKYSQMENHKEKKDVKDYSSFIDACFGGKLVRVMICNMCKRCLYSCEEFLHISLSCSAKSDQFKSETHESGKSEPDITLQDCLKSFMKVEGDNRNFSCDDCWKLKEKLSLEMDVTVAKHGDVDNENSYLMERQHILSKASKRYLFDSLPSVMVFDFKRLQRVKGKWATTFCMIDNFVAFDEELDVSDFIVPGKIEEENDGYVITDSKQRKLSTKYRLYGVVVYIGSIYNGRYASYVLSRNSRKREQRQWIYFCDKCVKIVTTEEVLSSKAYLLFYERVYI